jgi:hypothetical protein
VPGPNQEVIVPWPWASANRAHIAYTVFDTGIGYDALRYITNQLGAVDTRDSLAIDASSRMNTGGYNSIYTEPF